MISLQLTVEFDDDQKELEQAVFAALRNDDMRIVLRPQLAVTDIKRVFSGERQRWELWVAYGPQSSGGYGYDYIHFLSLDNLTEPPT